MTTTTLGTATNFINFSRASLATVTDSDGKVKWAPHNLLAASEQFGSSQWGGTVGVTITANSTAAPNGTSTADTLDFTSFSYHYQQVSIGSAVAGMTATIGVWLWTATSKATILLRLCGQMTATDETKRLITLTSTPTLYTISRTFTSSDTNIQFGLDNRTLAGGDGIAGNVIAWGAHLYRSDLGGMVANTSAYPMYNPTTPKNLLGYTDAFDNAGWTKSGATATANAAVAPNGLQTADLVLPNTVSAQHSVSQSVTASATVMTLSVYAKSSGYNFVVLQANDNVANGAGVSFNVSTGTIVGNITLGSWTVASKAITSVGDGWYRCSVVLNATGSTRKCEIEVRSTNSLTWGAPYAGDGTSGIYLWGAQLSDSASLDPYISNPFAAPTAGAYHGPRLDYDPVTLAAKGLLVEEGQRTNLLLRSEEFGNAAWQAKQAISVTANATTAPSGVATADKIVEDTTSDIHRIGQYNAGLSAVAYAYSVYVKPEGSARRLYVNLVSLAGTGALFDFTGAGSVIASSGTAPNRASSITAVGGGWYRCVVIGTGTATATSAFLQINRTSSSTAADDTYTGDGSSGFSFYGAQLEAGSFATSYIPTTSATVTRSADVASVATSAFPFNEAEGTIVAAGDFFAGSTTYDSFMFSIGNATETDRHKISRYLGGIYGGTRVSSAAQADISFGAVATNAVVKAAYAYKANDFAGIINGGSVTTDTSGSVPTVLTAMRIGDKNNGNGSINGHIRQITYIPRRLSNAELQSRTA